MTLENRLQQLEKRYEDLEATVSSVFAPKHGNKTYMGDNVFVDPSTILISGENATIRIGDNTQVWRGGEWTGPVNVGRRVFINQGSYLRPLVTIGDDVSLGPFVRLITDTHEIGYKSRRTGTPRKDPIKIGDGTWIGAGATVMGGVTIGKKVIVAVGAVVNRDVPDNVVVAGVPARIVRHIQDRVDRAELVPITRMRPEEGEKTVKSSK